VILDLAEPSILPSINKRMSFNINHSLSEPAQSSNNKSVSCVTIEDLITKTYLDLNATLPLRVSTC